MAALFLGAGCARTSLAPSAASPQHVDASNVSAATTTLKKPLEDFTFNLSTAWTKSVEPNSDPNSGYEHVTFTNKVNPSLNINLYTFPIGAGSFDIIHEAVINSSTIKTNNPEVNLTYWLSRPCLNVEVDTCPSSETKNSGGNIDLFWSDNILGAHINASLPDNKTDEQTILSAMQSIIQTFKFTDLTK